MTEVTVRRLQWEFWNLQKERINSKFFKSCVSEGFIPNGIKIKFNLAMNVNCEQLVRSIQNDLNYQASRILDKVRETSENSLEHFEESFEKRKFEALEKFGEKEGKNKIIDAKRKVSWKIAKKEKVIKKKLLVLKGEKIDDTDRLEPPSGSRQIKSNKYIKKEDSGLVRGAPFPQNLRPSRRNRPKFNPPKQNIQISEEDLEKRNPVVVTEREVILSEGHKSLCRKGKKFVPTPTTPVDNREIYEDWLKWRNRMRWKFYHAKKRNFQGEDPDFVKKPWYQHSEHSPPAASAAVEAYMEMCLKDMMDPDQRRKIHDNLKPDEREALKDFQPTISE